jgi:hypothetical protein
MDRNIAVDTASKCPRIGEAETADCFNASKPEPK